MDEDEDLEKEDAALPRAPMLLNEVQQQQMQLAAQVSQLGELKHQFAALQKLNRAMQVALAELQAREPTVAMR